MISFTGCYITFEKTKILKQMWFRGIELGALGLHNLKKLKKLIKLKKNWKFNFTRRLFYESFCEFLWFGLHSKGQLGLFTEITEILKVLNFFRRFARISISSDFAPPRHLVQFPKNHICLKILGYSYVI